MYLLRKFDYDDGVIAQVVHDKYLFFVLRWLNHFKEHNLIMKINIHETWKAKVT